ncbi:hypothetical protein MASR2M79_12520 [Aminivibrio sp.]
MENPSSRRDWTAFHTPGGEMESWRLTSPPERTASGLSKKTAEFHRCPAGFLHFIPDFLLDVPVDDNEKSFHTIASGGRK